MVTEDTVNKMKRQAVDCEKILVIEMPDKDFYLEHIKHG